MNDNITVIPSSNFHCSLSFKQNCWPIWLAFQLQANCRSLINLTIVLPYRHLRIWTKKTFFPISLLLQTCVESPKRCVYRNPTNLHAVCTEVTPLYVPKLKFFIKLQARKCFTMIKRWNQSETRFRLLFIEKMKQTFIKFFAQRGTNIY